MNMTARKSIETPWGVSQDVMTIAQGVIRVETAGHGGYQLSPERIAQIPPPIRNNHKPYAGHGWYEEDCDWAIVAVSFPELFSDMSVYHAVSTVRNVHTDIPLDAYLHDHPTGKIVAERVQKYVEENHDKYEECGMSGGAGGVHYFARRVSDGKRATLTDPNGRMVLDLPKSPFTLEDAQAAGFTIKAE